jgi:hemophore
MRLRGDWTFVIRKELPMKATTPAIRRWLGGVFAASAVGGVIATAMAMPGVPAATAATDPCAASEVARTIGSVATSMGNYLDAHPDTNTALTTISQQQGGAQSLGALKTYFEANPQAGKDMQALQSPLMGLSARRLARRASDGADRRGAGDLAARPVRARRRGGTRHRPAARARDHGSQVVLSDSRACSRELRELDIRSFSVLFKRKARNSRPILLSFALSVTAQGSGLCTFDEGA